MMFWGFFCMVLHTEEVNLQTFDMILWFYTKSFILVIGFKKIWIFSFFQTVKMTANYAEIGRVGKPEAGFQQVPLVKNFWNIHNIVNLSWNINN